MIARTSLFYGAVAGLCLGLHNGVLILADHVGLPLIVGVVVSFVLVAAMGYVLHSIFTFREALGVVKFVRYALAMSANIPLAFVTTWFWHTPMHLPMVWAAPVASLCMVAINFVLSHWAIKAPARQL